MQYVPGVLVEDIEKLTDEEWKQMRKQGIGGSDASKILGVSPFQTRKELYWDKCNIPHENLTEEENWIAKEVGHRLESLVIEIFKKKHPDWKVFTDRRMFFHANYPFMLANLDALVLNPHTNELYILEVKTTSVNNLDKWGKKHSNTVPPEYEAQGRHYMAVTGINGVIYICLAGNQMDGYCERWIMRDVEKEKALIEAECDFWFNYVQKGIEPPYNNGENAKMVLDALHKHYQPSKEVKIIPKEFCAHMEEVLEWNTEIAESEKKTKFLKQKRDKALAPILEYLEGFEGTFQDNLGNCISVVCQERTSVGIKSEALRALKLDYPEVYDKYATESTSSSWKVRLQKMNK